MISVPHLVWAGSNTMRRKLCFALLNRFQNEALICVKYLSSTAQNHDTDSLKSKSCILTSRSVVRLSGRDTASLLQGLVTNDINLLMESSPQVQYSMMLNVQGRVLYDLFMYNVTEADSPHQTVLVDCDSSVKGDLIKALKKYKLRKKVDISDNSNEHKVMAHWGEGNKVDLSSLLRFEDPRVPSFAHRALISEQSSLAASGVGDETAYKSHRYQWGIPEGVEDLPPGACLPLESNLVLMNGVNFQKGCYIGQELTARTFHTGVTRKRIMPVKLSRVSNVGLDTPIKTEKGKNAGKFRSAEGLHGLGLLRLAHINSSLSVIDEDGKETSLTVEVPAWWPASAIESQT